MKARWTPVAKIGMILFVEKRRERLHGEACRGMQKPEIPWVSVGIGFYSLFCVLPEGREVFQMKTGVFWGGELSP
jgi:hypothetical protein